MQRLYGNAKKGEPSKPEDKSAKGKDTANVAKRGPLTLESQTGGKERVQRIGEARNLVLKDATQTQRVKPSSKEASKGGGRSSRATKPWNDIADTAKVTRNGKRYVLTYFKGQQQLTEWVGNNADIETKNVNKLSNLSALDASKMTSGKIRALLKAGGIPKHVRQVLNKALADKVAKK